MMIVGGILIALVLLIGLYVGDNVGSGAHGTGVAPAFRVAVFGLPQRGRNEGAHA